MRVGILTYHHTTNYGATLQAYALQQAIKSFGHEVELINYQPELAVKQYFEALYVKTSRRNAVRNALKAWRMRSFLHSEMQLSGERLSQLSSLKKLNRKYDLIICGSDEIWNINSFRGFDPAYFLEFVDPQATRKSSYAASFGSTQSLGKQQQKVAELINQFDAVSVRDHNSQQIIEKECNKLAVRVLDPTFLGSYLEVVSQPKENKYVLIYGFLSSAEASFVERFSQSRGLSVISVGYPNQIKGKNFVEAGPKEWLGYFANATHIFTTFYHGVIFSIIFKKPFTVFSKEEKSIKVNDLLSNLNLQHRVCTKLPEQDVEDKMLSEIDYALVANALHKSISASKDYLSRLF